MCLKLHMHLKMDDLSTAFLLYTIAAFLFFVVLFFFILFFFYLL